MHLRLLLIVPAFFAAACGRSDTDAAAIDTGRASASADSTRMLSVDAYGIGGVRIGMTLQHLNETLRETLKPEYEINETCDFVAPKALPKGVALMILEDTVVRVDVDEPGILTKEGAGVSHPESRVIALYGSRARVEPHKYTGPRGHYVVVETPGDTLHRIVFETDGQRVERYRAGRRPGVDYIEGCA